MSDGIKALDVVIREIVYNTKIRDFLLNFIANPFRDIVQFQDYECEGIIQAKTGRPSLSEEGFQIGEPFDGDIEHAPVLFLSSNPAFNFDEVSPRYFPPTDKTHSGKIVMPEHIEVSVEKTISGGNYSFGQIKKMFNVPQREMSFEEIKDFFKTRIQTSPAQDKNDVTLRIPLKNGEIAPVKYWTCIKNDTELLLPSALKNQWSALTPSERAREIMKYAVCMEIVPFRSNSEIGVNTVLLNECWENYTKHLLALSGAKVFVLVGNKVLDVFAHKFKLDDEDKDTLEKHGTVAISVGTEERIVVKVDFNSGAFSRFDNTKLFSIGVLKSLCGAVAASSFVNSAMTAPPTASVNLKNN